MVLVEVDEARKAFLVELEKQRKDEIEAYNAYMKLAAKAEELGFTNTAETLKSIAQDEARHASLLAERIVSLTQR